LPTAGGDRPLPCGGTISVNTGFCDHNAGMPLDVEPLAIPDVLRIRPRVFGDDRGFFFEAWNQQEFDEAVGHHTTFVQDNHSRSAEGVLRGLHYQLSPPQGKLVRVGRGRVFDVAVDIRRSSATFGKWVGVELSDDDKSQLWIPPGFAHGFLVLSDSADVLYKATTFYDPPSDRSILWSDTDIGIEWPLDGREPALSTKDQTALSLAQAELFD
jgi:dTDP-4-dehydrorhamnose 3,5-epimerase